jgi:uncharacterized protein YkwD
MRTVRNRLPFAAVALVAALLFAGVASFSAPAPALALTNCDVSDPSIDSQEQAFLGLINTYRAQNGLSALTISVNLNRASSWMAADMATKDYFSHTDSLGRDPSTRASNCGFPGGAGENIAAGTVWDTAQEAFDAWKASPGHNANMLNSSYKQIGIARYFGASSTYGWYWVTDFSLVSDGTNALGGGSSPTATPTRTATATPTRTATATPTRTATPTSTPPAVSTKATMLSPLPGSTLHGSSVTFQWSPGSDALEYGLYVGTRRGSASIYNQSLGTGLSATVTGLPTSGRTIYVRLWTRSAAGWQYVDYTYRTGR